MMLPLFTVELISYTASWLTFLGFIVGIYECWRHPPLRLFFALMLIGYSSVYAVDIGHGKNPLSLISPPGAPPYVYFWAPVCRQMFARSIVCGSIWSLLFAHKTYIPREEDDQYQIS